jgi:uncharacterized protein with NRDE domain
MCLLLVATHHHPDYRLVIAANRDEFYSRPTAPAHFWDDHPSILAGRDLERNGTWLGIDRNGRFAAVTNIRSSGDIPFSPRSRGLLTSDFLVHGHSAGEYARSLESKKTEFDGCNLIVADRDATLWWSNQTDGPRELAPGVYGLSNHLLDTPWPKVVLIKQQFEEIAHHGGAGLIDSLFTLLANSDQAPDEMLPRTGIGVARERSLSSIFIAGEAYGTRSSTVVLIGNDDHVVFVERRFGPHGEAMDEHNFEFDADPTGSYDDAPADPFAIGAKTE